MWFLSNSFLRFSQCNFLSFDRCGGPREPDDYQIKMRLISCDCHELNWSYHRWTRILLLAFWQTFLNALSLRKLCSGNFCTPSKVCQVVSFHFSFAHHHTSWANERSHFIYVIVVRTWNENENTFKTALVRISIWCDCNQHLSPRQMNDHVALCSTCTACLHSKITSNCLLRHHKVIMSHILFTACSTAPTWPLAAVQRDTLSLALLTNQRERCQPIGELPSSLLLLCSWVLNLVSPAGDSC